MSPREAYDIYTSVKLHFKSEKFDALKYGFKTMGRGAHLERQSQAEQLLFIRLGQKFQRREDLIDFMVANTIVDSHCYVFSLLKQDAWDNYLEWQKRRDSFMYSFKNMMEELGEKHALDDLLKVKNAGDHPEIIRIWTCSSKHLTFEMLVVIDILTGFLGDHAKKTTDNIFWGDFYLRARKYRSFMSHVDRKKCRDIIIHAFAKSKPLLR